AWRRSRDGTPDGTDLRCPGTRCAAALSRITLRTRPGMPSRPAYPGSPKPQPIAHEDAMNSHRTLRTTAALLTGLLLGACAPAEPFGATSQALTDNVLLPAYTQWAESDR